MKNILVYSVAGSILALILIAPAAAQGQQVVAQQVTAPQVTAQRVGTSLSQVTTAPPAPRTSTVGVYNGGATALPSASLQINTFNNGYTYTPGYGYRAR
ncbi:MAG: hypothetical protein LLG01_11700 [Planctomycetaceae bacterium]|nr:hypothetical protein [Planctomycetaceae bacterium]